MSAQPRRNSQTPNWADVYGSGVQVVEKSILACSACRSDRALPSCLPCAKLQQTCVYPARRLKPGPKCRTSTSTSTSSQRWKKCPVDEVKGQGQELWQGGAGLGPDTDDDDDDTGLSIYSDEQGNGTSELGEDSGASASPEVEINFVKAVSLSSLIHPTHEPCSPVLPLHNEGPGSSDSLLNLIEAQSLLMEACHVLGLSIQEFQRLTDSYFDNMTAFSLFHRPSFGQKIQNIKDPLHLQALFSAMFSYSVKFEPAASREVTSMTSRFQQLASDLIERSLKELPDQPPSLCLLQALTVLTFCELTNGVRARAWRLLGSCVRLAYELHMHLIDYEAREEEVKVGRDLARWTADEERRRCWWAIWEMDTFASTIRRCPTAIDWTMIDTYLPVPDEMWFNNQYHPGCFLETEPVNRWKMLTKQGNTNPNAWLIVISSIMRNAQVLLRGNLRGVLLNLDPHDNSEQLLHYFRNSFRRKTTQEDSTRLKTLIHALQNVITKLPDSLVYRGEYLDFGSDGTGVVLDVERKRLHAAKYNIYLSIQLARFMIYHHHAFGEIVSGTIFSEKHQAGEASASASASASAPDGHGRPSNHAQGLANCLQAADDICALTERCSQDHVKHVNPFLASTVWLAASLQVLRKIFAPPEERDEATAKCDTLRATCERFTAFWQTPLALLSNLDSLATRLCYYRDSFLAAAAGAGTGPSPAARRRRSQSRRQTASFSSSSAAPRPRPHHNHKPTTVERLSSSGVRGGSPKVPSGEVNPSSQDPAYPSSTLDPQPQSASSFTHHHHHHHDPHHDGGGGNPEDHLPTPLNLDYYRAQTAEPDLLTNPDHPTMGCEPGLDSVFSKYLLDVFSEQF